MLLTDRIPSKYNSKYGVVIDYLQDHGYSIVKHGVVVVAEKDNIILTFVFVPKWTDFQDYYNHVYFIGRGWDRRRLLEFVEHKVLKAEGKYE